MNDENKIELPVELDHIDVDLDVMSFSTDMTDLETIEEVNDKIIKYLERMMRGSYEYKQYISYLKTELDITKCVILDSIDIRELAVGLEFHHYPLTLYDIVYTITFEQLSKIPEGKKVSMFDIMESVMKDHYDGIIGLVPVTTTVHELAHSGSIKIPYESVYGNIDNFVLRHDKYLSPEMKDKVLTSKLITKEIADDNNKEKLERNTLNYNIQYNKEKDNE